MVHRVKTHPKAAGLPGLRLLLAVADPGDGDEVILREDGVVVGKERGPLPLRKIGGEEGLGAVGSAVEAEADPGGPSVVRVLDELLQHGSTLGVVDQDLADAPGEVDPLPEILEQVEVGMDGGLHPSPLPRSRREKTLGFRLGSTEGGGGASRHRGKKKPYNREEEEEDDDDDGSKGRRRGGRAISFGLSLG